MPTQQKEMFVMGGHGCRDLLQDTRHPGTPIEGPTVHATHLAYDASQQTKHKGDPQRAHEPVSQHQELIEEHYGSNLPGVRTQYPAR